MKDGQKDIPQPGPRDAGGGGDGRFDYEQWPPTRPKSLSGGPVSPPATILTLLLSK